jgi:SAM-dependent methyltransferase
LTPEFPRIQLSKGELPALALAENEYDLTWCSRVIHHLADPVVGIRELGRITKAGGRVVLREGGFGPRFLPYDVGIGAPGIEDRLRVAQNVWFDRMHAQNEHGTSYPHGWLGALRAAGLNNVTAKTFLYELTPPFSGAQVSYLRGWLNDCATNEEYPLAEEDREALRQLSDETSQHDAFRRDDLHLLYAASIYLGDKSD